jgi:hypothetical protein
VDLAADDNDLGFSQKVKRFERIPGDDLKVGQLSRLNRLSIDDSGFSVVYI